MTFGQRLRVARENAGYSQQALGEACKWGENAQSRIANYEAGTREPTLADIDLMASVIGIDPAELAYGALGLHADELALLQSWRLAGPDGRAAFQGLIAALKRPKRSKRQNSQQSPGDEPKSGKSGK